MDKQPDEKKVPLTKTVEETAPLSDSELEQVSGGLPDWLKAELDSEVRDRLK